VLRTGYSSYGGFSCHFMVVSAAVKFCYSYFGCEGECVCIYFQTSSSLISQNECSLPFLMKGIRCIPGTEPELDFTCKKSHQCALRLFCAANQSTEAWISRRRLPTILCCKSKHRSVDKQEEIAFKVCLCPELKHQRRQPEVTRKVSSKTRSGADFDTSHPLNFQKPNSQNQTKHIPLDPHKLCGNNDQGKL